MDPVERRLRMGKAVTNAPLPGNDEHDSVAQYRLCSRISNVRS